MTPEPRRSKRLHEKKATHAAARSPKRRSLIYRYGPDPNKEGTGAGRLAAVLWPNHQAWSAAKRAYEAKHGSEAAKWEYGVAFGPVGSEEEIWGDNHTDVARWHALAQDDEDTDSGLIRMDVIFQGLDASVTYFCERWSKYLSWEALDPSMRAKMEELSPRAQVYVSHRVGRCWMARALLWHCLNDCILSQQDARLEWTNAYWESQACLYKFLQAHTSPVSQSEVLKLLHFRRTTGIAIQRFTRSQERVKPESLKKIIMQDLGVIFKDRSEEKEKKAFQFELDRVVERAIEVDLTFSTTSNDNMVLLCDPESRQLHGFPLILSRKRTPNCNAGTFSMEEFSRFPNEAPSSWLGHPVDLVIGPALVSYYQEIGCCTRPSVKSELRVISSKYLEEERSWLGLDELEEATEDEEQGELEKATEGEEQDRPEKAPEAEEQETTEPNA